jgi:hypothetical protein
MACSGTAPSCAVEPRETIGIVVLAGRGTRAGWADCGLAKPGVQAHTGSLAGRDRRIGREWYRQRGRTVARP